MTNYEPYNGYDTAENMKQVVNKILAESSMDAHEIPQIEETVHPLKQLRKEANIQGGALLFYFGILNVAVFAVMMATAFKQSYAMLMSGALVDPDLLMQAVIDATGKGYLIAAVISVAALLLWKKPQYVRNVILQKGKPMRIGTFFALLSLAMAPQLVAQLGDMGMQWLLELFGMDASGLQELGSVQSDTITMFLYVGVAAPIVEELLFRGLLLRGIAPYNKKLAVFASALLFGLFHGNLAQTPYAFMVGVVLGYVTLEYSIVWAIVLHMFNNLGFAMLLPQLLSFLPVVLIDWIMWAVIIAFFLAAVLVVIVKHERVIALWKEGKVLPWQRHAVFRSPTVIIMIVLSLLTIIETTQLMFL